MIKLHIKDYCQSCPHFEPVAEKIYSINGCLSTNVSCSNEDKCDGIYNHIKNSKDQDTKEVLFYRCTRPVMLGDCEHIQLGVLEGEYINVCYSILDCCNKKPVYKEN